MTPWLKFLWETFRTVLEILRNNPKLEALYQVRFSPVAASLTASFTRLAGDCAAGLPVLPAVQADDGVPAARRHSPQPLEATEGSLARWRARAHPRLSRVAPASPGDALHPAERRRRPRAVAGALAQQRCRSWAGVLVADSVVQEAFRSVEDIHGLMAMSKKQPKPATLTAYYQKLAHIFWLSNNYLFHAYAFYKYFTLNRATNKNATPEQLRQYVLSHSYSVLLSILIPFPNGDFSSSLSLMLRQRLDGTASRGSLDPSASEEGGGPYLGLRRAEGEEPAHGHSARLQHQPEARDPPRRAGISDTLVSALCLADALRSARTSRPRSLQS